MSDTSASNEVGKSNLYEKYNGEIVNPVFYALDINLDKLKAGDVNPNSSTSGVIDVIPREAGSIYSTDLLVGNVAMTIAPITPEIEEIINKRAKASGGVGKGEGGVVALKAKQAERNKAAGREQGM